MDLRFIKMALSVGKWTKTVQMGLVLVTMQIIIEVYVVSKQFSFFFCCRDDPSSSKISTMNKCDFDASFQWVIECLFEIHYAVKNNLI